MQVVKAAGVAALKHLTFVNQRQEIHYAFAPRFVHEAINVLETYYGCQSALLGRLGKEEQTRVRDGA
jgi:hypothetical protein